MIKKTYQIYAKEKCLLDLIPEEEFETTWKAMNQLVNILQSDYTGTDLSYREIVLISED